MCWTLEAFMMAMDIIQGFIWRLAMYRVEHIASMSWRNWLGGLSCFPSRHHILTKGRKDKCCWMPRNSWPAVLVLYAFSRPESPVRCTGVSGVPNTSTPWYWSGLSGVEAGVSGLRTFLRRCPVTSILYAGPESPVSPPESPVSGDFLLSSTKYQHLLE